MTFSQNVKRKTQNHPTYHQKLSKNMDNFVDAVFSASRDLPPEELYGTASQLKRAALSVPLNYHEGFGRFTEKSRIQYLRISFGSLRECQYLIDFCRRQRFINQETYDTLRKQSSEIYAMIWGILKHA